jgi:hypothetical protein
MSLQVMAKKLSLLSAVQRMTLMALFGQSRQRTILSPIGATATIAGFFLAMARSIMT